MKISYSIWEKRREKQNNHVIKARAQLKREEEKLQTIFALHTQVVPDRPRRRNKK